MSRVIEIRNHYLAKWPKLKEFVDERPGTICLGIQVDEDIEAVMLVGGSRIHHIHVKEESRRGGFGSELVAYAVRNYSNGEKMRCVVAPNNTAAVRMFMNCDFGVVGKDVTWGDNRYVMEHGMQWEFKGVDPLLEMKAEFEDMADHLYVVEAAPVRIK
ncbi:N-acetyltransferase [Vibrio phage pVa-21]|nr:N-acetyltransferase [Vibrio phage pVa-21]